MWNQHEADLVMQEDIINTRLAEVNKALLVERQKANAERQKAKTERQKANAERQKAKTERRKADAEVERMHQAVNRLSKSGYSVEELALIFTLSPKKIEAIIED